MQNEALQPEGVDKYTPITRLGFRRDDAHCYARRRQRTHDPDPAAKWNVIAQDVLIAQYHLRQNDAFVVSTDNWGSYPANRARLLKRMQETRVSLDGASRDLWAARRRCIE
jgi:hypothetical protein